MTPPAPSSSPLDDVISKLASFDPLDWERRLQELADSIQIPDVAAAVRDAISPLVDQLTDVVKELKKLAKPGAGGGPAGGGSPPADPPAAAGPPAGGPTPPAPDPTPAQGGSLRDTLFGIPSL